MFDGRDPPYSESAKPNPLNKYGTTKAEAERAVLSAKPGRFLTYPCILYASLASYKRFAISIQRADAIVLRVPVLYGGEEYVAESAVSVLCQLLNDRTKHVKVSDYEIRYPSHTEDIAFIVVQLAERRLKVLYCMHGDNEGVLGSFDFSGTSVQVLRRLF